MFFVNDIINTLKKKGKKLNNIFMIFIIYSISRYFCELLVHFKGI